MLSKCANPECSEVFRYLHQGKIFHLSAPEAHMSTEVSSSLPRERFWLCDQCAKRMTLAWEGTKIKLTPLPIEIEAPAREGATEDGAKKRWPRRRAASANRGDG